MQVKLRLFPDSDLKISVYLVGSAGIKCRDILHNNKVDFSISLILGNKVAWCVYCI
jgi:hypothetical protein